MEKLYTVYTVYTLYSKNKGADCGSDRELLIAKFRLKLKKVGKTTRPFRYDLNQVPYDYTVEVGFRPDANSIPILSVKWYKFDMNTR